MLKGACAFYFQQLAKFQEICLDQHQVCICTYARKSVMVSMNTNITCQQEPLHASNWQLDTHITSVFILSLHLSLLPPSPSLSLSFSSLHGAMGTDYSSTGQMKHQIRYNYFCHVPTPKLLTHAYTHILCNIITVIGRLDLTTPNQEKEHGSGPPIVL